MSPSAGRERRVILLAGIILAPALILAFLSWRSLRQEREERRGEVLRLASSSALATLRGLEAELKELREEAWRSPREGAIASFRNTDGSAAYPRSLATDAPSLEERVRRENPELLHPLAIALQSEFAKGDPGEASTQYAKLEEVVESASTRVALLHARARAAMRGGRTEEARALYERLSREAGAAFAESGIPYQVLAMSRLAELDPGPGRLSELSRAMDRYALPGHVRAFLLSDLPKGDEVAKALASARALERLESALARGGRAEDEIVRLDDRPFLLAFRVSPTKAAGAAIALDSFPSAKLRESLKGSDGIAYEVDKIDPAGAGEMLARQASREIPSLVLSARLADPTRLEVPRGRLVLTGGLVTCLIAALLFGTLTLLRTVRRELAVAQMKSDFVSGVSHDLKTPLTSIRMFAEMLESGRVASEEKRREYERLIHRESLRLSRLVENVLDFARIEEGRKTFALSARALKDVVSSALETFRMQVDGRGVRLKIDLSPESMAANVDADAVGGAILNLLDNAVKYGGEAREIEVRLARRGDRGEISVKDNGPGISPEERERIFEKFFRGSSAVAGPAGGAGLGLALVKFVMDAHRGSVSVESEPGKGSRFILNLPLCPESSS